MSEKSLIEAALFVAGEGVSLKELEKIAGLDGKAVQDIVEQLKREYMERDSGLIIEKGEKGFLMRIKPEFEERVVQLVPEADLPKSMLKTLALIAYEQPIMQSDVVKLRGNRVYDYIPRLVELGFVRAVPEGRSKRLSTTEKFREYFRMDDVSRELSVVEKPAEEEGVQTTLEPAGGGDAAADTDAVAQQPVEESDD